jgi:hypothetical protein
MADARAAGGISKCWVAYGVVAVIALLAFALAPLYVTLPADPPRKRYPPPPAPVLAPSPLFSGKQVIDDF